MLPLLCSVYCGYLQSPLLYFISPGFTYFITGSFYLLTLFTHFVDSPPPNSCNHQCVLCIYEFSFWVSTCKWYYTVFVLLGLTEHNNSKVHSCRCKWQGFFFMISILPCPHTHVHTCHIPFIHPSVDAYTVSTFGYCKQCCSEHGHTHFFSRKWFHFLWIDI